MAAIVTPKMAKHQHLTNNDCGDSNPKVCCEKLCVLQCFLKLL
jgi:hypothetical protein